MKPLLSRLYILLALIVLTAANTEAIAQAEGVEQSVEQIVEQSIPAATDEEVENIDIIEVKVDPEEEYDYIIFTKQEHLTPKQALRKERNFLELNGGMQGSLTNMNDPWIETSGGESSVTLLGSLYLKHTYTKNKFSLQTLFDAKFGYYRMAQETTLESGEVTRDPIWYKNQDEVQMEITPSMKFSANWSYGMSTKFRSQFTKGYLSSTSQESYNLKSDFMSPGYLDISGGLIYVCPLKNFPITLTLSPVALSAVYVTNETVRENAQYSYLDHTNTKTYVKPYGVDPHSSSMYEGGSSVQIYYDKKFGKNEIIRYTTTLHTFYGWMSQIAYKNVYGSISQFDAAMEAWESDNYSTAEPLLSLRPTVRWENKIEIAATKFISTTLNYQIYYNRSQSFDIQTQTLLSVGILYKFANKKIS